MARELAPAGQRSSPKPSPQFPQTHRSARFYDGCAAEREQAPSPHNRKGVLLPDYAENDINTVTNIARILVQDVSDVFRVIEQRGFETPKSQRSIFRQ